MSFYTNDGYLYCEDIKVKHIQDRIPNSPIYLYSLNRILENYKAYKEALDGIPSIISYALKANSNLTIARHLREAGASATLVSGNELKIAMAAGFDPKLVTYNGNGKTTAELSMAVLHGVMVNIDSEFDLQHIKKAAAETRKTANVTLRINPDVDSEVHPYVATGFKNSKFGIMNERLDWYLKEIENSSGLNLVGLHCHLGSTIKKVRVFQDAMKIMIHFFKEIREKGFNLKYLNLGGGLGIDYEKNQPIPTPSELIDSIRDYLIPDLTLIVEPGRSMIGDASILITRVTGVKTNGSKNFIVIDGSMAELIRPCLYDAYHHIGFIEPVTGEKKVFDIVGPICESADFLGKDRELPTPHETAGLVVYDVGAYCYIMSSNYNLKMRPAEYLVNGNQLIRIRRAETMDDYMRLFENDPVAI
ncbi:diaminopimelate decarboxylase [bacterium]|nr:diaminopimelate decarboxylase [bacterium]